MGVDPRPFTLRQLLWMVNAKREHDFDVQALQTVAILSAVGVKLKQSEIQALNPARKFDPIKEEVSAEKEKNDTKYGMDLLGKALKEMPVPRKRK